MIQAGVLVERLEVVPSVPAGGLSSDLDGIEVAGHHLMDDLLDEGRMLSEKSPCGVQQGGAALPSLG